MSLKSFHILFICVSTLFCAWFAWWCFSGVQAGLRSLGVLSVIGTFGLLIYGFKFFKKLSALDALAGESQ